MTIGPRRQGRDLTQAPSTRQAFLHSSGGFLPAGSQSHAGLWNTMMSQQTESPLYEHVVKRGRQTWVTEAKRLGRVGGGLSVQNMAGAGMLSGMCQMYFSSGSRKAP